MDQHLSDMASLLQGDARTLEGGLKALWERARRAAEVIVQLREEKRVLQARIEQLERELHEVRRELSAQEQLNGSASGNGGAGAESAVGFAHDEKEVLAGRVRELLSRLDAYL